MWMHVIVGFQKCLYSKKMKIIITIIHATCMQPIMIIMHMTWNFCLDFYSRSDVEQFFDECGGFKHPNIVERIGMCLDSPDGFPHMILPLYPNGNLNTYFQKRRRFCPFMNTLPEVSIFGKSVSLAFIDEKMYTGILYWTL